MHVSLDQYRRNPAVQGNIMIDKGAISFVEAPPQQLGKATVDE